MSRPRFSLPWAIVLFLATVPPLVTLAGRTPADPTRPLVLVGNTTAVNRPTLRVGTFNIHGGRAEDGTGSIADTAAVLRPGQLDLIGLNELHASWGTNQAHELGEALGLASLFAPTEHRWGRDHFGNGLLTNRPLRFMQRIPLPGTKTKGFRNVILTETACGTETVRVLHTHIDTRIDRDQQLAAVTELFLALRPPAILMGDFNADIGHPLLSKMLADPHGVRDPLTEWGAAPPGRIDHIFTRGLNCTAAGLVENQASDHPHAWAELTIPR